MIRILDLLAYPEDSERCVCEWFQKVNISFLILGFPFKWNESCDVLYFCQQGKIQIYSDKHDIRKFLLGFLELREVCVNMNQPFFPHRDFILVEMYTF